jgi:hypothetical protein
MEHSAKERWQRKPPSPLIAKEMANEGVVGKRSREQ